MQLGSIIYLKQNSNDTLTLWIMFIILNIFDTITTIISLSLNGTSAEVNSIVRYIIIEYGLYSLIYFKILGISILLLFKKYITSNILIVSNVLLVIVVCINIIFR